MHRYLITAGSFRLPGDEVKTVGDEIDLADDVATNFASMLQRLPDPAPAPAAEPAAA